jgi:hypothetical protein
MNVGIGNEANAVSFLGLHKLDFWDSVNMKILLYDPFK